MPSIIHFSSAHAAPSRARKSSSAPVRIESAARGSPVVIPISGRTKKTESSVASRQVSIENVGFEEEQEEILNKTPSHLLARMYLCKAVSLLSESGEDERRLSWLIEDCVSLIDGRAQKIL